MASARRQSAVGPARASLVALLLLAPGLIGGVPAWSIWVLAPLAAIAVSLAYFGRSELSLPVAGWTIGAAAGISLVQSIPLPRWLLGLLNPQGKEWVDFALEPLGLSTWRTLSFDPPATARDLSRSLIALAAFAAAFQVTRTARSSRQLVPMVISATGAFWVVSALLHLVADQETLFGLYAFTQARAPLLTPFGNPNHLAGALVLSGTLAAGLLFEKLQERRRVIWAGVWLCCFGGVLFSNSRAGIAAFALSHALLLAFEFLRLRKTRAAIEVSTLARIGAVVGVVATAGLFMLGERLATRFSDVASVKLKVQQWPHVLTMIREHLLSGVGRGAFEVGFTRYYADHFGKTVTHPENLPLQWLSEAGVPLTLALMGLAAWGLVQLFKHRAGQPWEHAALAALIAVFVQNLFDFSLEFSGVAVPLAAAAGAVAAQQDGLPTRSVRWRFVAPAVALLLAFSVWRGLSTLPGAEARVAEAYEKTKGSASVRAVALREIDVHPHDYLLWAQAGAAMTQLPPVDPKQGLAFASRALWLYPRDSGSHLVAARALRKMGNRPQALLEYRLAMQTQSIDVPIHQEAAQWARGVDELEVLAGEEHHLLIAVATAVPATRRLEAAQLLERRVLRSPSEPKAQALALLGARMMIELQRFAEAEGLLDTLSRQSTPSPELALARYEVLAAQQKFEAAAEVLDQALAKWPGHYELSLRRIGEHMKAKEFAKAQKVAAAASAVAIAPHERLELTLTEAGIESAQGHHPLALAALQRAVRMVPSSRTHQSLAQGLLAMRRYDEAIGELRAAGAFETQGGRDRLEEWVREIEKQRGKQQQIDREIQKGREDLERREATP